MSEALVDNYEGVFVIDSDAKASWALDKIKEARADCDRWVKWYAEQSKAIKEQTDFNTATLERMLAEYFAGVPHKKTKTQESYALPGGKLVMKTQNPEYKRDDATVIAWAKANGFEQYVKTKEVLDWAGLKAVTEAFNGQLVTEDGEIVPGVEVVERPEKFIVEV